MDKNILYGDLREYAGGDKHVMRVTALSLILGIVHNHKEKIYNLSFCRRGLVGVFMNLARKWDNIENMSTKEDYFQASYIDALFDIATYALKMIIIIAGIDPKTFIKWLKNVYCETVGVSITDAFTAFDDEMASELRRNYGTSGDSSGGVDNVPDSGGEEDDKWVAGKPNKKYVRKSEGHKDPIVRME